MRVRLAAAGFAAVILVTGCSGGGGSSSKSAAGASTTAPRPSVTPAPTTTVTLPVGTPKVDQLCSLTASLADKFRGAKKPDNPQELAPFISDLANFFQQAQTIAPKQLQTYVQKLGTFYGNLSKQVASGSTSGSNLALGELAQASSEMRVYFKNICGVDDSVFNF